MPTSDSNKIPTANSAIAAALNNNWKQAVHINTAITKVDKTNVDAHNRLGFALLKLGQITEAKRSFQKVLSLDSYNQIAFKNLKKLTTIKSKDLKSSGNGSISPLMFLEDPGKTKIAVCVNAAPVKVLSALTCGQEVFLRAKKHCVEIRDEHDIYLAVLPDDLSFKLIKFLTAGNTYKVVVKGVGKNALTVFLRELHRGKRFANQPSFATTTSYIPFSRPDTGDGEKPNVTPTGEEDDEEPAADDNAEE